MAEVENPMGDTPEVDEEAMLAEFDAGLSKKKKKKKKKVRGLPRGVPEGAARELILPCPFRPPRPIDDRGRRGGICGS